jgi:MOSC domain-containing protein YiiM
MEECDVPTGCGLHTGGEAADNGQEQGEAWRSVNVKQPVNHPLYPGKTNLEGDGQADLFARGRRDQAVLIEAADHDTQWSRERILSEFPGGVPGENFTVTGLDEHNVCIGDVYRIEEAVV